MVQLKDLIGKKLDNFTIQEYTEIYKTGEDGAKVETLCHIKDEAVAKAFAQSRVDAAFHKTQKVFVVTDGEIGFSLREEPLTIINNAKAKLEVARIARNKLTPEEREVLGL